MTAPFAAGSISLRLYPHQELDAGTSQIAGGLLGLGIAPGDHVALSCPNVPWFPLAYFGIFTSSTFTRTSGSGTPAE